MRWLYLDLNSFFASVEQELNPKLRDKPVAVVPMMADSTFVIAASYPAKKHGVKTGTRVKDAKLMCPGLILVEGSHSEYIKVHEKVIEVVESCLPVTAVCSIDEFACRLTGRDQKEENAIALTQEIKEKLRKQVGVCITGSIGLSSNRFLAKVAADMLKPDGLTLLPKESLPGRLFELQLRDLPGIGPRMERRLNRFGITQMPGLWNCTLDEMRQIWGGVGGEYFYQWLRGEETFEKNTKHSMITHSHVLPPNLRNIEGATEIYHKLTAKLAFRLRKERHWARSFSASASLAEGGYWSNHTGIYETCDTLTFIRTLNFLLETFPRNATPVKIDIVFGDLIPDQGHTPSFFENQRSNELSKTLDFIFQKYGKNTVYFGGQHRAKEAAPMRIAFQRIPTKDEDF